MKWGARFESDGSLVTLTVVGVGHVDGFDEYLAGLLNDPCWRPGMRVFVDFLGLQIGHLEQAEVRKIVDLHKPYLKRIGNSPVAVVVSQPVDFGVVRMWQAMAGEMFPVHRVFYDAREAMNWLQEQARGSAGSPAPAGQSTPRIE